MRMSIHSKAQIAMWMSLIVHCILSRGGIDNPPFDFIITWDDWLASIGGPCPCISTRFTIVQNMMDSSGRPALRTCELLQHAYYCRPFTYSCDHRNAGTHTNHSHQARRCGGFYSGLSWATTSASMWVGLLSVESGIVQMARRASVATRPVAIEGWGRCPR